MCLRWLGRSLSLLYEKSRKYWCLPKASVREDETRKLELVWRLGRFGMYRVCGVELATDEGKEEAEKDAAI